jgi:hypothetical protein
MAASVTTNEQQLLQLIRKLPPAAVEEVRDFTLFLAARHCSWDYSDAASVAEATDLMAADPFMRRELEAMNAEFLVVESDGLEAE